MNPSLIAILIVVLAGGATALQAPTNARLAGAVASPVTGTEIDGLEDLAASDLAEHVHVLHAGTAIESEGEAPRLVSAGGRVLSVVALGDDLAQARDRAYEAVDQIDFPGSHHRTDIALRASRGEIRVPR